LSPNPQTQSLRTERTQEVIANYYYHSYNPGGYRFNLMKSLGRMYVQSRLYKPLSSQRADFADVWQCGEWASEVVCWTDRRGPARRGTARRSTCLTYDSDSHRRRWSSQLRSHPPGTTWQHRPIHQLQRQYLAQRYKRGPSLLYEMLIINIWNDGLSFCQLSFQMTSSHTWKSDRWCRF